jgi:hypothetical protein
MKRCSRLCGISCGALLLLAPALTAAQDPVPAPKRETVTIRGVSGTFELKGTSSADLFEFTQCGSKSGSSGSTVLLTLPLEIEAGPNDSIEHATTLLREAVAKGLLTIVEPSGEPGRRVMVVWSGGLPEFMGVIESVSTKYTMFLPSGTPVRATASVRVKEADKASMKQGGSKETDKSDSKKEPDCTSVKQ